MCRVFGEMDKEKGDLEIGHYQFVGECFMDGLMSVGNQDEGLEKYEAFALH